MPQAKTAWVDFKAIKARVSIVQILERYGVLDSFTKAGTGDRLSGACPVHGGTNRTHFRVSVSKNCWNCFGTCQSGGNVIDFVAKKEDIEFRDAAILIEEWFPGEPVDRAERREKPRFDPEKAATPKAQRSCDVAPREETTVAEEGDEPNKPLAFELTKLDPSHPYLKERGLSEETIATFGLGYCGKGVLRGYVAIPIHDSDGEIVAYAGRWPGTPEDGKGKYKLPEGFRKSVELFNYHRAVAADHEMPLAVVEGFFDAMKLHQAGYERVVAIMGSSMSATQEELLTRFCATPDERLILLFDGDDAGRKGQADALVRLSTQLFVRAVDFHDRAAEPEDLTAEELRALLPMPGDVR